MTGYWANHPASIAKAQEHQLDYLFAPLQLNPSCHVLDIGGGQGGCAIWLAKKYGCKVLVIDLVEAQILAARKRIKAEGLEDLVTAVTQDAITLDFSQEFTHIISIEAIFHIPDKAKLFQKMFKFLKKGGEFKLTTHLYDKAVYKPSLIDKIILYLVLGQDHLELKSIYEDAIIQAGFQDSCFENISAQTLYPTYNNIVSDPIIVPKLRTYLKEINGRWTLWFYPLIKNRLLKECQKSERLYDLYSISGKKPE
jgi:cyclopropane fatty-acyl-phospholipid synthase-like methyltransferase